VPSADRVPLWRADHVPVKQLIEDFAQHLYLPGVSGPEVIVASVKAGAAMMTLGSDSFTVAEVHDASATPYRGIYRGSWSV